MKLTKEDVQKFATKNELKILENDDYYKGELGTEEYKSLQRNDKCPFCGGHLSASSYAHGPLWYFVASCDKCDAHIEGIVKPEKYRQDYIEDGE